MYSPSMTWMHLFPGEMSWECPSAPPWLRQMLSGRHGDARALAAWEDSAPKQAQLRELFGFAGVNCRGATEQNMRAGGLDWVQRFAVLPSLEKARWFIPLDTPAVASAAFSLFTPTRASARIKLFAVKLATRTGLRFWYRDEICLAQRTPPALYGLAQRLFPDRQVRLAFSAGAPEPARNRKPSFLVCDLSGELLAFGKVSAGPLSQRLMEHEAQMVERLHAAMTEAPAPRLLFAGAIGETFITLQRPLGGRTPRAQLTPSHMRLLERLRIGPMKPAACVAMVATLPARLAALPSPQPLLIDAMEKVLPVLRDTIVPSTIVHGDFAPWNLRELHGEVRAFDWEYGEIDGLPLVDQMHFTLQTGFILRNWKSADALQSLGQLEMSKPLGLAPRQVRAIQIVYLVDNLVRLYSEGYGDCDDVVMWYRDLLPQLLARETVAG